MSFHSANTLMDALKARLESLPLDVNTPAGEKLLQRVEYFGTSDIQRAFEQLYFTQQRLALIVPVRIGHTNDRDRLRLVSVRSLTVDVLFGDRSFDKGSTAALVGGAKNVGVIEMNERTIDSLFETPLALDDVICEPGEGAPLLITNEQKPNDPGRVCWVQTLTLRAGMRRAVVP